MAASIESRVPFLDDEIVDYVARMPAQFKLRGWQTKAVLRAAVRDVVPAEILTRKKMGFPVPIGRWLRGPFQPVVDEFILSDRAAARGLFDRRAVRRLAAEHQNGFANHGDRLWLLANLEIWHRLFVDGEATDAVMLRPAKASGRCYARAVGKMGGLWPLNTGGRQRSFHMLSDLARRHQVVLVTTHGPADDPAGLEKALTHGERVVSVPYTLSKPGSAKFILALLRSVLSRHPVSLIRWHVAGSNGASISSSTRTGSTSSLSTFWSPSRTCGR